LKAEVNKVKMILKSPANIRPDVNEKDDNGRSKTKYKIL
jgi:hypothetical protein